MARQKSADRTPGVSTSPPDDFATIAQLIASARQRAVQAVNTTLIELYWQIGE